MISKRLKPQGSTEAFAKADAQQSREITITAEDLATVMLRFEGGAKGCVSVGQVCAGHKNGLWFEVNGRKTSLRWKQEQQNELWIGERHPANELLPKDPSLLGGTRSATRICPAAIRKAGRTRSATCFATCTAASPAASGRRILTRTVSDVRRRLPLRAHRRSDPEKPRERQHVDDGVKHRDTQDAERRHRTLNTNPQTGL